MPIIYIIEIIFVLTFLIQLYFYFFIFKKLAAYIPSQISKPELPVSVVICAKNEEKKIEKNLISILQQNYELYEVIVVDDASTDNTAAILLHLQKQFKNLSIVTISPQLSSGKKNALKQGIQSSKYDCLLFTDADCIPKSKNWISKMAGNFSQQNEIILGYGAYEYRTGFLNTLIRFDTIYIAIQYFSYALAGMPYMGVGRNLAYKKKLFADNNGFESHKHVLSGDDDLFINEVALNTNTVIEIDEQAHTTSVPKESWSSWLYQKRRHLTTGVKYKPSLQFYLGLFQISIIVFYISFVYIIATQYNILPIIVLFLIRIALQIFTFKACLTKLNETHHVFLFPIYELFILILNLFLVISNFIYTPNSWQKN